MCHLRLKVMQRLGPDGRKTLYMTAPVAGRSPGCNLEKRNHHRATMADEHSREYEDDYSSDSGEGGMESMHNSGPEDGAPDGAEMDSEISRHGELSASKQLETENDSDDSDGSINHTPAQKSRRPKLALSPCKSPSTRFHGAGLDSSVHVLIGLMFRAGIRIRSRSQLFRTILRELWPVPWPMQKLKLLLDQMRKLLRIFD